MLFEQNQSLPDDQVLSSIKILMQGIKTSVLPYYAQLAENMLLHGRTELFKRFIIDFLKGKNSLELYFGLRSQNEPLICNGNFPVKSVKFLDDQAVRNDLASALSIDPDSQSGRHFFNDILGQIPSTAYIRSGGAYVGSRFDLILPYADQIIQDQSLLFERDSSHFTFFHAAISRQRADLVAKCLSSPLCEKLLNERNMITPRPLLFALHQHSWEIADMLLDAGADPCATQPEAPLDGPITDALLSIVRNRSEIAQLDSIRLKVISRLFEASPEPLRFFAVRSSQVSFVPGCF